MFRRPARDRNYEFWGDQTFYGENPPQAAVISWFNKKPVGEVKLKITDAAGREIRELSGPPLANSNKAGMQAACWDLRVQPNPAPPPRPVLVVRPFDRLRTGWPVIDDSDDGDVHGVDAGQAAGGAQSQEPSPFGAGCGAPAGQGGGGGFGGGARSLPDPTSSAASTTSRWLSTARRSTPSRCA